MIKKLPTEIEKCNDCPYFNCQLILDEGKFNSVKVSCQLSINKQYGYDYNILTPMFGGIPEGCPLKDAP